MAVTFLACATSALHWLARPHLITMLFVVILLFVLDRVREGRTRWLFVLPFFTILWTNLHGGFFVELIILGGYTAGEIAAALFAANTERRRGLVRQAGLYAVTTACCALATLVESLHLSSAPAHLSILLRTVSHSEHFRVSIH